MILLGPLPCRSCRRIVAFVARGPLRFIADLDGRAHRCALRKAA